MLNKPNFLIVGVPKSGTSSFYHYLRQHPDIYLPPSQKELHFFSYKELIKNTSGPGDKIALNSVVKTIGQYCSFYKDIDNEKAIGDISPSYFYFSKSTIPKIKRTLGPNTKIIISLRDPVNRAFSNFLHQKRLQFENLTFIQSLDNEMKRKSLGYSDFWRYSEHSKYYENCQNFITEFGSDNVRIILFEDLVLNPQSVLKNICEFLEVDESYNFINTEKIHNKGAVYKKNAITKIFIKPSKLKFFVKRLVGEKLAQKYKRYKENILSENALEPPKIKTETINKLKASFKEDVTKIKTLNIDISKWQNFN